MSRVGRIVLGDRRPLQHGGLVHDEDERTSVGARGQGFRGEPKRGERACGGLVGDREHRIDAVERQLRERHGESGLRVRSAVGEDRRVESFGQRPEQAEHRTFAAFTEKLAGEGFAFLHSRIDGIGPVLTAVRDERVVGAIGPMETMPDPNGKARLLPQYFGVFPEYRGLGLGRRLWREAMHQGATNGTDYQLLRTTAGGASDRLCQAEGLTDRGFVCTTAV
jgi:ribosomal protein S18 acetylase RimI-like enzyme